MLHEVNNVFQASAVPALTGVSLAAYLGGHGPSWLLGVFRSLDYPRSKIKVIVNRPRPYAYATAPEATAAASKAGSDRTRSFYSGHSAMSFAASSACTVSVKAKRRSASFPAFATPFETAFFTVFSTAASFLSTAFLAC